MLQFIDNSALALNRVASEQARVSLCKLHCASAFSKVNQLRIRRASERRQAASSAPQLSALQAAHPWPMIHLYAQALAKLLHLMSFVIFVNLYRPRMGVHSISTKQIEL